MSSDQVQQLLEQIAASHSAQQQLIQQNQELIQRISIQPQTLEVAQNIRAYSHHRELSERIKDFVYNAEENYTFELWYERYINVFETQAASMSDPEKLDLLTDKLSHSDYNLFAATILPLTKLTIPFGNAVKELKRIFGRKESHFTLRYKCIKTKMESGENSDAYAARVNLACEQFDITKCSADEFKVLVFVSGLNLSEHNLEKLVSKLEKNEKRRESAVNPEDIPKLKLQDVVSIACRLGVLKVDDSLIINSSSAIKRLNQSLFRLNTLNRSFSTSTLAASCKSFLNRACGKCEDVVCNNGFCEKSAEFIKFKNKRYRNLQVYGRKVAPYVCQKTTFHDDSISDVTVSSDDSHTKEFRTLSKSTLKERKMISKFRGALLGALTGDCCGVIFEGEVFEFGEKLVLHYFLKRTAEEQLEEPLKFSDDTAMTRSVAKCLVNYEPDNYQKQLAVNFVKEYFVSPSRGYGAAVTQLFHQLKRNKFEDLFLPANQQFNGRGSYGNGAAMRISPVALFCLNKPQDFLIDLVRKTSIITHSNVVAINGAILQAIAVHKNLSLNSGERLDVIKYVDDLLTIFATVEQGEDENGIPEEKHFTKQLNEMKNLLNKKFPPPDEEVVNVLGNSVNALFSVPTAVYCFLRNSQSVEKEQNQFMSILEYTISLGGDTDTIASMACALSGAYFSDQIIAENLVKQLETSEEIINLADQLYEVASSYDRRQV